MADECDDNKECDDVGNVNNGSKTKQQKQQVSFLEICGHKFIYKSKQRDYAEISCLQMVYKHVFGDMHVADFVDCQLIAKAKRNYYENANKKNFIDVYEKEESEYNNKF